MARGAGRGGNGARGRGAKARGEAVPAMPEEASPTSKEVPKANSILAAFDRLNKTEVPSPVSIASTADVGGSSPSAGGSSPPSVPLGQLTPITPHHGNANQLHHFGQREQSPSGQPFGQGLDSIEDLGGENLFRDADDKMMEPRLAAREQRLIEAAAAGLEAEKHEECQTAATETEEETIWREACTKGFDARGMMGLRLTRNPEGGKDTAYKSAKLSSFPRPRSLPSEKRGNRNSTTRFDRRK